MKICQEPDCENLCEGRTDMCATHNMQARKFKRLELKSPKVKKPIAKVSGKMAKELEIYVQKKTAWLKGKRCAVFPNLPADDVHHMRGRIGPLLNDERFWCPVSRKAHDYIETHPEWAKKEGFSLSRLEKRE